MSAKTLTNPVNIVTTAVNPFAGLAKMVGDTIIDPSKQARDAQQKLEEQRRKELEGQAATRAAAEGAAAVRGKTFGTRTSFLGSFGAGSGNTATGIGAGALFR